MDAGEPESADRCVLEGRFVLVHMFVAGYRLAAVRMFVGDTFATADTFVAVGTLEVVVAAEVVAVGGPRHIPCDGGCSSCVYALRHRIRRLCTRADYCCCLCVGGETPWMIEMKLRTEYGYYNLRCHSASNETLGEQQGLQEVPKKV